MNVTVLGSGYACGTVHRGQQLIFVTSAVLTLWLAGMHVPVAGASTRHPADFTVL